MCLAVPMKITAIDGSEATCVAKGVERKVSMFMMGDGVATIGSWVLVHVGYALQVITEEDAHETWNILEQMTAGEEAIA